MNLKKKEEKNNNSHKYACAICFITMTFHNEHENEIK